MDAPNLIAVTGASGHVGAALVRALLARRYAVRALDLQPPPCIELGALDWRRVDVLDEKAVRRGLEGVRVVYHLAALISIAGDHRLWNVNVEGVRIVAEAALARGVKRLVHCSSVHAFDLELEDQWITEESPRSTHLTLPLYDRSKAAGEVELQRVVSRGLDAVIVNPTGVIGPYDYGPSRMGRILLALSRNQVPALVPGAFDWVDSRDVAQALIAAAQRGRTGENYLVAGRRASLRELAGLVHERTGSSIPAVTLAWPAAEAMSRLALNLSGPRASSLLLTPDALHALKSDPHVDDAKARRELGHWPTPLQHTVTETLTWFATQGQRTTPRRRHDQPRLGAG